MKSLNKIIIWLFSFLFWGMLSLSRAADIFPYADIHLQSKKLKEFTFIKKKETRDTEFYLFETEDQYLQIEKISGAGEQTANVLIEDDIISIKAIYANSLSAYPGDLSNEIVCNEKYLPTYHEKNINGTNYTYAIMYSSSRLGLGACTVDGVKYKHLRGWIYCKNNKELYTIKYYAPLSTKTETLETMLFSFSEH